MNADCNPRGKNLKTLESAKEECKNSKQCQGVLYDAFTDPNNYYLCPEDATTTFDNDIKSSLFEKRMIGKIFLKCYTQIICMIYQNRIYLLQAVDIPHNLEKFFFRIDNFDIR